MTKLTSKQLKFAELYSGNAFEAAAKAGYAPGSAAVTGYKLLRNARVLGLIQDREKTESQRRVATRQRRQEFWTGIMEDAGAEMKDRLKASELLGKSECDFTEKIQHSGGLQTVIEIRDLRHD